MRRRGHGLEFLHKIFVKHKGKWIVKQINGATSARGFWISTLEKLKIKYMEDVYEDKYWGVVNRQIFHYK
jgi:predicted acetyltransferase